jgi:dephospho-CoA kinase
MNDKMPIRIICICGSKRVGKDTVADFLQARYGFHKAKIAQPLKDTLKVLFGFSDDELEQDIKDEVHPVWKIEPRKVMQFFGTEVMQYEIQKIMPDMGRMFWVKRFLQEYYSNDRIYDKIVVSDVRFLHEYEALKEVGAEFWKIERNELVQDDTHSSETEMKEIPVEKVIENDGTLEELYDKINTCFDIKETD